MSDCAVCGFEVNDRNPNLKSTHEGNTYSFCCPLCKGTFDALPEQFVNRTAQAALRR